ncbi:G/U mismatch-specific DNA glycosylase [Pyrenochaeta sp. DS3sAY3a]|nr:G/U mismatch-specific DNA glycosylase [Pyrenochaeta sp. DS3sAY3a]
MRRTRSTKIEVVEQVLVAPSEESPSDSNDTPESSVPTSFNGQLAKYQFQGTSNPSAEPSSAITPPPRTQKRLRSSTTTTISKPVNLPKKKQRKPSKYAPPSKYAHLTPLTDILTPNLIGIFVGTNPGVQTATAGHAYAHPSNLFWKLLHTSGLTDRRLDPTEDRSLPAKYCMGNTNIVDRPSRDAAELSKDETSAGTAALDAKVLKYKPEAVCIVGKGIWEAIWRYRYARGLGKGEFAYGWQDAKHNMGRSKVGEEEVDGEGKVWDGARVFVTTSTSGLAAGLKPAEKEAIWKPFGDWVCKRREERGFVPGEVGDESVEGEEGL